MKFETMENNRIRCPKCDTAIDVSEVLAGQIESALKQEYSKKLDRLQRALEEKDGALEEQKTAIETQLKKDYAAKLQKQQEETAARIRKELEEENKAAGEQIRKELQEKTEKLKELHLAKAEVEKLKRDKEEAETRIKLEMELQLSEQLKEEKLKLQQQVEEGVNLKLKEKEKIIADLTDQVSIMKRKAEQGSMQLQGEVQELELEQVLSSTWPMDLISEVKKGARGADVLQEVRSPFGALCGKIYYESKRTKHFEPSWIAKLKSDNLTVKADILILVTSAMPEGQDQYHLRDGVWICRMSEVRALSAALRYALLRIAETVQLQHGRESKMELLYNYLTGPEFRNQMTAIIEGFNDLQSTLEKEKRMMQRSWAEREKQIDKVLHYTNGFVGSVQGIAGSGTINLPELND